MLPQPRSRAINFLKGAKPSHRHTRCSPLQILLCGWITVSVLWISLYTTLEGRMAATATRIQILPPTDILPLTPPAPWVRRILHVAAILPGPMRCLRIAQKDHTLTIAGIGPDPATIFAAFQALQADPSWKGARLQQIRAPTTSELHFEWIVS